MCLVSGVVVQRYGRFKAFLSTPDPNSGEMVGKWRQVFEECELTIRYSTKTRRFGMEVINNNQADIDEA